MNDISSHLGDYLGLLMDSIAPQDRGSFFRATFRREGLMKDTKQAAGLSQISEKTTPSRLMGPTFLSFTVKRNSRLPMTPRSVYPVDEPRLVGWL